MAIIGIRIFGGDAAVMEAKSLVLERYRDAIPCSFVPWEDETRAPSEGLQRWHTVWMTAQDVEAKKLPLDHKRIKEKEAAISYVVFGEGQGVLMSGARYRDLIVHQRLDRSDVAPMIERNRTVLRALDVAIDGPTQTVFELKRIRKEARETALAAGFEAAEDEIRMKLIAIESSASLTTATEVRERFGGRQPEGERLAAVREELLWEQEVALQHQGSSMDALERFA